MSTDGNGYTAPGAFTARVFDYATGSIIGSNDLNAIQDGIIALSGAVDDVVELVSVIRTASTNVSDTPAPSATGGVEIYVEVKTAATTPVVIDNSINWRDRHVRVDGFTYVEPFFGLSRPGGGSDNNNDGNLNTAGPGKLLHYFYAEQGHAGASANPGLDLAPADTGMATDRLRIYADSTTGYLMMVKNGAVDNDIGFIGFIKCSPKQNHY